MQDDGLVWVVESSGPWGGIKPFCDQRAQQCQRDCHSFQEGSRFGHVQGRPHFLYKAASRRKWEDQGSTPFVSCALVMHSGSRACREHV